jgi:hypothetical protein
VSHRHSPRSGCTHFRRSYSWCSLLGRTRTRSRSRTHTHPRTQNLRHDCCYCCRRCIWIRLLKTETPGFGPTRTTTRCWYERCVAYSYGRCQG